MVDLVKIRKKAKKGQATGDRPQASGEETPAPQTQPAPQPEPEPQPKEVAEAEPLITHHSSLSTSSSKLDKFKEEAGRWREIAATTEVAATTGQLEVLTFIIAGEHYALDIERIVEIVKPRPITR